MPGPTASLAIADVAILTVERDGDEIRIDEIVCHPGWALRRTHPPQKRLRRRAFVPLVAAWFDSAPLVDDRRWSVEVLAQGNGLPWLVEVAETWTTHDNTVRLTCAGCVVSARVAAGALTDIEITASSHWALSSRSEGPDEVIAVVERADSDERWTLSINLDRDGLVELYRDHRWPVEPPTL